MIKKHGVGCKKCIVHWGYALLSVWLRLLPRLVAESKPANIQVAYV